MESPCTVVSAACCSMLRAILALHYTAGVYSSTLESLTRLRLFSQQRNVMLKSIDELTFANRALKQLPIDEEEENYVRQVRNACFSLVKPTPVKNPKLVCYSIKALQLLDLDEAAIDDRFIQCLAGNEIINGSQTASHCYCGHQFGTFAGQLGDGAAIYLGEVVNSKGEHWELQLKGAGKTPYSRGADGRKVLRSSIREFLCSEAMFALGIPTTRAATCIVSEDKVERDMFYDGHPKLESCTVISRIALSFIRFGSFEIFKPLDRQSHQKGPSIGRNDILVQLLEYVISSLFPSIDQSEASLADKCKQFYKQVVLLIASTVAQWQAVGFCHGVLNTDNMSVLGLTLDYGPFGFLDHFDPDHIPNTSDSDGRYRFRKQPEVCLWNLVKFAEALQPVVPLTELSEILSEHYFAHYNKEYFSIIRRKFGLTLAVETDEGELVSDQTLVAEFLDTMTRVGGDYTNCFRALSLLNLPGLDNFEENTHLLVEELVKQSSSLEEMLEFFQAYLDSPMVQMRLLLFKNFPEQFKDDEKTQQILVRLQYFESLKELDSEQMKVDIETKWNTWLKLYTRRLKHEVEHIKHDETEIRKLSEQRTKMMNQTNPRYVLRNYLAEKAIQKAEQGDYEEVKQLLAALEEPYQERPEFDHYTKRPPSSVVCKLRVSCSS